MERKPFGPTGVDVAVIGQGTWQLRDKARATGALQAGLDLGMTHLDTAELYRGSEEVIRDALLAWSRRLAAAPGAEGDGAAAAGTGRDRWGLLRASNRAAEVPREARERVFVVSKVLPRNASYEGTLRACEASLARLGTGYVDAYLLHWWSASPIEETMRAMGELADRGKTRFVGVSNLDVAQLEAAQEALGRRHRIACDQVLYHLGERGVEHDLVPHCKRKGIAVVGYSPFGGGRAEFPQPGSPGHAALERVGAKHGRTARQVALRFLTREPHAFAIPKAERVEHVRENAGGAGWRLDEEDVRAIEAAFPLGRRPRELPAA